MKKIIILFVTLALGALLGSAVTAVFMKNEQSQPTIIKQRNNDNEVATTNVDYKQLPTISISQEKAIAIFKKFYSNADINELALTIDHDKYVYELAGFDTVKDCSLKIDANNGKILGQSTLRRTNNDNDLEAIDFTKTTSRKTASEQAIKVIGNGKAVSWKLSQDSQTDYPLWLINVANGNQTHEVKINAFNNEIVE